MKGEELRDAILAAIGSHPDITVSPAGHVAHALRFISATGVPLALEPKRQTFQNLWVRSDSVNLRRLTDIDRQFYTHRDFAISKPNHDLFGEQAFKGGDLIRFKVTDLWQAVRVIAEAAGLGDAK